MESKKTQSGTIAPFLRSLRGEDETATSVSQAIKSATTPSMIVNKTQFVLLDALAAHAGAMSMTDLEQEAGLEPAELMSAILASAQAGFVTIDWPSGNLVRLTEDGREALDRFNA
jgi:hypothetical protein